MARLERCASIADLRELAQGIFPAMLAEEGLATAIEALAEAVPLAITALPGERFGASVEAAAYFVVAETVRQNAAGMPSSLSSGSAILSCRARHSAGISSLNHGRPFWPRPSNVGSYSPARSPIPRRRHIPRQPSA